MRRWFSIFLAASVLSFIFLSGLQGQAEETVNPDKDISFYQSPKDAHAYSLVKSSRVRNIIFLIGDGMGLSQVNAARIRATGGDGTLYLEKMPVVGLLRTRSENKLITDSAAAGTALAVGEKTHNGQIAMNADGVKFNSILRKAQEVGKSTGLVVTSTMTHATPAAFGSNVADRNDQAAIAPQYIENGIDILFGGGKQFFMPQFMEGSSRKDDRNILSEAQDAGYGYVDSLEALESVSDEKVLGLFQVGPMTTYDPEPSLAQMTRKAIELLSRNNRGFFLMVEGSQIDWAGHANNIDKNIRQTLLFDMAVKEALDFARKDRRTLVVVTADHETGGLIVLDGSLDGGPIETAWNTTHHTPVQVPLYAYGPGAERFMGVYDNTEVPKRMADLIRVDDLPNVIN